MYNLDDYNLTRGEQDILIDGLTDDVALVWILIHLGIRTNPPVPNWVPSSTEIQDSFASLKKLVQAGLIKVGRIEYVEKGVAGRLAPVRHVPEDLEIILKYSLDAVNNAGRETDWAFSCWAVNTEQGDEVARQVLKSLE